jgi:CheY-like chemotaxis protein
VARHVRGILFIDYVRMLRRYGASDRARASLPPDEAFYLSTRLDPEAWYPMEAFQRLGLALLAEVVGPELRVIRLWGRSQVATLVGFLPELGSAPGPGEAVTLLSTFVQGLFDFPCVVVERVEREQAEVRLDFGMGGPAEAAARLQAQGVFEELVTSTGGRSVASTLTGPQLSLRWRLQRITAAGLLAHPRVLLVDDEPLVRSALRRSLARVAEVATAGSLPEALSQLAAQPFDAVVSDFQMGPTGDGLQLLEEVRRRFPAVRRVLHSATPPPEAAAAVASGVLHQVLQKPAPFDVLYKAVATPA